MRLSGRSLRCLLTVLWILATAAQVLAQQSSDCQRLPQNVVAGRLLQKAQPAYPQSAHQARIQGTVVLGAVIASDGTIKELHTVSGQPMLAQAALDAVKQWRYEPYRLCGESVEVNTQITVKFVLAADAPNSSDESGTVTAIGSNQPTAQPQYAPNPEPKQISPLSGVSTANQIAAKDTTWDIARILKDAEQGNSWAQFNLGNAYATGKGVPKDEAEAVRWFRKAAEQGNPFAQQALEGMSASSQVVSGREATHDASQTQTEYTDRLTKLAESGDAKAEYDRGRAYATGDGVSQNKGAAADWYLKSAQHGLAQAQNAYGELENEAAVAVYWFRKAAEQGDSTAQYNLANAYANGRGVTKDRAEAAHWYRKAAEQGLAKAQFSLGNAYATGGGVTKDAGEAAGWYHKAAEQGYGQAQFRTEEETERARIARIATKQTAQRAYTQRRHDEEENTNRQLPNYRIAAITKLGLHHGQSQATVKSILQRDGFRMPWVCGGGWSGGTWYSTCHARRGADTVWVVFSVYSRVRYVNPDTQVSTIIDEQSDKLTAIKYMIATLIPGTTDGLTVWGEDGKTLMHGWSADELGLQ